MRLSSSILALGVAACALPNPCPSDMTRVGNVCVRSLDGSLAPPELDAADSSDVSSPARDDDASALEQDASEDAEREPQGAADADVETSDGTMDAASPLDDDASPPTLLDASPLEEAAAPRDGGADTAMDTGIEPLTCLEPDLAAWRTFQLGNLMQLESDRCHLAIPFCDIPICDISNCLRETAQVASCQACVREELQCMRDHCAWACSGPDAYDACRVCACAYSCFDTRKNGCGPSSVDACADCDDVGCRNISVIPALQMQIINQTLLIMPPP